VGTTGPEANPTGSVVWTSPDGRRWDRVADDGSLAAGWMASVTPVGDGYLAVGSDLDVRHALSWRSTDGRTWIVAGPQPALDNNGLAIRMADVVADGDRYVAVGTLLFGTQYGKAGAWTSTDGLAWTRAPDTAAMFQGEMLAVATREGRYVAVGTYGAPDNYIPTVWLSPR
jgi:hypothetical protein